KLQALLIGKHLNRPAMLLRDLGKFLMQILTELPRCILRQNFSERKPRFAQSVEQDDPSRLTARNAADTERPDRVESKRRLSLPQLRDFDVVKTREVCHGVSALLHFGKHTPGQKISGASADEC